MSRQVAKASRDPGEAGPSTSSAAAGDVFRSWQSELTVLFLRAGVPAPAAASYAALTLASVEGAMVLSRAEGDLARFDDVVDQLLDHVGPPHAARPPHPAAG